MNFGGGFGGGFFPSSSGSNIPQSPAITSNQNLTMMSSPMMSMHNPFNSLGGGNNED